MGRCQQGLCQGSQNPTARMSGLAPRCGTVACWNSSGAFGWQVARPRSTAEKGAASTSARRAGSVSASLPRGSDSVASGATSAASVDPCAHVWGTP